MDINTLQTSLRTAQQSGLVVKAVPAPSIQLLANAVPVANEPFHLDNDATNYLVIGGAALVAAGLYFFIKGR